MLLECSAQHGLFLYDLLDLAPANNTYLMSFSRAGGGGIEPLLGNLPAEIRCVLELSLQYVF